MGETVPCNPALFAFFCGAAHAGPPVLAVVASDVIPGSLTFAPGEEREFNIYVQEAFGGNAEYGVSPFAITGTNAGDFVVVSENCSGNDFDDAQFCTVRLRYNGSGQAAGDNEFRVTCTTVAAAAFGPAVVCDGNEGTLLSLFAQIAAIAIPLMTPLGTTLLALLMLGFFFFHGLRRTR